MNKLQFRITSDEMSGGAIGKHPINALIIIVVLFFATQIATTYIDAVYQIEKIVP